MTASSLAIPPAPSQLSLKTGKRHDTRVQPVVELCRKTVSSGATATTHPQPYPSGTTKMLF